MKYDNLLHVRFGKLVVISLLTRYRHKGMCLNKVECHCDCGRDVLVNPYYLKCKQVTYCGLCDGSVHRHRRSKDLSGKHFGRLTVIKQLPDYIKPTKRNGKIRIDRYKMFECRCSCKNHTLCLIRATSLTSHYANSCGCLHHDGALGIGLHNLVGKCFGYWLVLAFAGRRKQPRGRYAPYWECRCKCGTVKDVEAGSLVNGGTLSCGCHKLDVLRKQASKGFGVSKDEVFVSKLLNKYHISYIAQKMFSDLRGKKGYPLSYDFYVDDKRCHPFLIECQGQQHYHPVAYFGGKEHFEVQHANDVVKKQYADKHHLPLLYLPYNMPYDEQKREILSLINNG